MTVIITSCVWVVLFTLLNQAAQRSHLIVQAQRDEARDALSTLLAGVRGGPTWNHDRWCDAVDLAQATVNKAGGAK